MSDSIALKISQAEAQSLMTEALCEAELAFSQDEVPVGAVVAHKGQIIARAHNLVEKNGDASAHAEMLAIRAAASHLGNWRLEDCVLCVTLEPCTMCAGAIMLSRIPIVVFGAEDPRMGAFGSLYDLSLQNAVGPSPRIIRGIEQEHSADLLKRFFQAKR